MIDVQPNAIYRLTRYENGRKVNSTVRTIDRPEPELLPNVWEVVKVGTKRTIKITVHARDLYERKPICECGNVFRLCHPEA